MNHICRYSGVERGSLSHGLRAEGLVCAKQGRDDWP